jgi:signal transduction histidine kinase
VQASALLVFRRPASLAQVWVTCGIALALFLVFVLGFVFGTYKVPSSENWITITSSFLILADAIAAILLFAQARVLHTRPLYVLAAGFLLAGLLIGLRVLCLLIISAPADRYDLPLGFDMAPYWFYLTSHAALPPSVMIYAWLNRAMDRPPRRYLTGPIILIGCAIVAATMGETILPWSSPILLTAVVVMLLTVASMAVLAYWLRSELDFWLMLMLWGWLLETALIVLTSPGGDVGWYAARSLGLLSGLFVLFELLAETSTLYGQTLLQLMTQQQESENRFLIRDAVAGSIAHELRQPVAAILLNAQAGKMTLANRRGGTVAQPDDLDLTLDDIIVSCQKASELIESTRSIFGRGGTKRHATDLAALLRTTLAMVAVSARENDASVQLEVEGRPKLVTVNRLQMQQALLNLFQNAVQALSHAHPSNRVLLVRCAPSGEAGVTIRVEDNGPGISPAERERIFDTFFTTRDEGTGLGLPIARAVIEAHGGRLSVEPRLPTGTAFVIQLPFGAAEGASLPDAPVA